jgi:hypothetical protein
MPLLDLPQARAFVSGFHGGPMPTRSLWVWADGLKSSKQKNQRVVDPSGGFKELRAMMVADAQLNLGFAIANYRRGVELISKIGMQWAFVTLYYSAFFGAQSILQVFGAAVRRRIQITPSVDPSGQLELTVQPIGAGASGNTGSHQRTWEVYYLLVPTISQWIPTMPQGALHPPTAGATPTADVTWCCEQRNVINYDPIQAGSLCSMYPGTGSVPDQRLTLTGDLREIHRIAREIVDGALLVHHTLAVGTSALNHFGFPGDISTIAGTHMQEVLPYLPSGSSPLHTASGGAPPSLS